MQGNATADSTNQRARTQPANRQIMATSDLLQQLTRLQQMQSAGNAPTSPSALMSDLLEVTSRESQTPAQVDQDVINLVTMLFDFILDDRQIPVPMKAQLARLQIPLLKVALIDSRFFKRGGHPARQLLNTLATAALGCRNPQPGETDLLGARITAVVDRVSQEFTDDVSLFAQLLEDFNRFNEQQQSRELLRHQRLRDTELERARHEESQQAVTRLLEELEAGYQLPEVLVELLHDPWRRVLQWYWLH